MQLSVILSLIGGAKDIGNGWSVVMTHAVHNGDCAGFVITTPDKERVYFTGDTDVFMDMQLINEFYKPTTAMMCIGDVYTMNAKHAAYATYHFLPCLKKIYPMHYKTFPNLTGTPQQLRDHLTEYYGAVNKLGEVPEVIEIPVGEHVML